jgi:hypothetical protein
MGKEFFFFFFRLIGILYGHVWRAVFVLILPSSSRLLLISWFHSLWFFFFSALYLMPWFSFGCAACWVFPERYRHAWLRYRVLLGFVSFFFYWASGCTLLIAVDWIGGIGIWGLLGLLDCRIGLDGILRKARSCCLVFFFKTWIVRVMWCINTSWVFTMMTAHSHGVRSCLWVVLQSGPIVDQENG